MRRRDLFKYGALAASLPVISSSARALASLPINTPSGQLGWLENTAPAYNAGQTWGLPWPQGQLKARDVLCLSDEQGNKQPLQTWVNAYWPDGSVKWTGHALAATQSPGKSFKVQKGSAPKPVHSLSVKEQGDSFVVDTGVVRAVVAKQGEQIIRSITRGNNTLLQNAHLLGQVQNQPYAELGEPVQLESFKASIKTAVVEQTGPLRAVIKITGTHHRESGEQWLPFSARLYFYAGGESVRICHTFVFDGDEHKDFIRALGLRFELPQRDEIYNRHVRFVGEGDGLWAESPLGITGLRRDPGKAVRDAQIDGRATPPIAEWDKRVSGRLQWIPVWNDYTLSQLSANGFAIKKRTKAGHAWIDADQGHRASGVAYFGGATGGVLFGMRDFWQLHPTQIDIRNAGTELAQATIWNWSPEAPAMDVRFYHDDMGMDTFEKQRDALEITYEDFEPGFGAPQGVARTSDFTLSILGATPSRANCIAMAETIRHPAQIIAAPQTYLDAGVFGSLWSLPDRSTPAKTALEDRLAWSIDYYTRQVQQRHWFGFWNYGDVMHTYDADRHVWRYDVGGYAWDNSELSPDLWLWYSFLRTGSAQAFRLAEAMTRHNRDVDIYHLGRFAGLGSRHNVQHWGCSAKQLRISTSIYRRFHYFLTSDERTGDVLWEVVEADKQLANVSPGRKLGADAPPVDETRIGIGTDFGSAAANWLTAWERTGDKRYRQWLFNAMKSIGDSEFGFFAKGYIFDPATKKLTAVPGNPASNGKLPVSHLNSVFGLVEACAEMIQLIDVPSFKNAWLRYARFYNAPRDVQTAEFGAVLDGNNLTSAHSRLTAYAAASTGDANLAARAWSEFLRESNQLPQTKRVEGPLVLNPVDEADWVSTNDSAQWGLAAIQNLALVGKALK